jgi:hypothetical protein
VGFWEEEARGEDAAAVDGGRGVGGGEREGRGEGGGRGGHVMCWRGGGRWLWMMGYGGLMLLCGIYEGGAGKASPHA